MMQPTQDILYSYSRELQKFSNCLYFFDINVYEKYAQELKL
jgi:hypothetical protein